MAKYISKKELEMLERDRRENCGDEGYKYIQRRNLEDDIVSDRHRRNREREERKEKKKKETVQSQILPDGIETLMYEQDRAYRDAADIADQEQERLTREIQLREEEIRRMSLENEREKERIAKEEKMRRHKEESEFLEELRREREERIKQREYESRSLEEMGVETHSTESKHNHTYHGPEKETKKKFAQNRLTDYEPEMETPKKSLQKDNTYHNVPVKQTHTKIEEKTYTYQDVDTHHGCEDEINERMLMQIEDKKLMKKMEMRKEVKKLEEKVARTETSKGRNEGEKFMSWIDEKYDALSPQGPYDNRKHRNDYEYSDDSESTEEEEEEEDSEDEMLRLQKGIQLLKTKEVTLRDQVREKELEKRRIEEYEKMAIEKERRAVEEETKRRKMLEKKERMRRLKEEQLRLLHSIRQSQSRLETLELAVEDTDEYSDHGSESAYRKKEYEYKQTANSDHHRRKQKETPDTEPKLRYAQSKLPEPKLPRLKEESFEEWKVEVEVMMNSNLYPKDSILHCVRNSVSNSTGNIRKVLPTISINATTEEIIEKLDNIYGDRRSGESHLAEFYKSKQTADENVAEWGVRLEIILQKAWKKGQISKEQMDQMLKRRFWKYLHNEKLKMNTRIFYESCKSFEDLRKEVRIEENEMNSDSDSSEHKIKNPDKSTTKKEPKFGNLLDRLKRLEEQSAKKKNDIDNQQRDNRDDQYQEVVRRLEQLEDEQDRHNESRSRRKEVESEDGRTDYTERSYYERNGRGRSRYRRPWRYERDDSRYSRGDEQRHTWYRGRGYRYDRYNDTYRRSEGNWRNNNRDSYYYYNREDRQNDRDERHNGNDETRDRQERNQNRNEATYQSSDQRGPYKEETSRSRRDEDRQTQYPKRNQQGKFSDRKGDNLNK